MRIRTLPIELIFWISALTLLAFAQPGSAHFTLCPLANLGINWCPGCGLGRSITYLFHGDFKQSWQLHWLAIPALGILAYRIFQLSHQFILSLNQTKQA